MCGLDRELNPGPLAPEARIIPLDHQAICEVRNAHFFLISPLGLSLSFHLSFSLAHNSLTFSISVLHMSLKARSRNLHYSSRGRVVKALDLKSNGVSPRRFESCRLRTF